MNRCVAELQAASETTGCERTSVAPLTPGTDASARTSTNSGSGCVQKARPRPESARRPHHDVRTHRMSKLAIEKLNELFDFQHFIRGPGSDHVSASRSVDTSAASAVSAAPEYTHRKLPSGGDDEEQGFEPLESCCSASSNVLGIPPPRSDDIHALAGPPKALDACPMRMSQEHHLLLHDLLSGDIYED